MKNYNLTTMIVIVSIIALSSCKPYYQLYTAEYANGLKLVENELFYEDKNCKIYYNFWDEHGEIGFSFYNKSNQNIYVNMEESFYIENKTAYNYFKNREYTNSTSTGLTVNRSSTLINTGTVTQHEEKIIIIPPQTIKHISEYNINDIPVKHCDLNEIPQRKNKQPVTFTNETSPFVFSNRITYSVGSSNSEPIVVNNEFYVKEIVNLKEKDVIDKYNKVICGEKSDFKSKKFIVEAPNKFYIKYNSGQTNWIEL